MEFESTQDLETVIRMEKFFGARTEEEYIILAFETAMKGAPDWLTPVRALRERVFPQLRLRREARREIEARREGLEWPAEPNDAALIERWAGLDPARVERLSTRDQSVARDCKKYADEGLIGSGNVQQVPYGGYSAAVGASVKWPMYERIWCWA